MTDQGALHGRVAIVTGAASGIGRATAELFAAQGAAVVAADVNDEAGDRTVAAITGAGGRATFVHADVSVESEVEAMVQVAESVYGGVDAAFNNAGVSDFSMTSFEATGSDLWEQIIGVDLRGVWLCMKHELAVMVPRGRGTIVNTASVAGLVGTARAAAYTAAKHGVIGLTRAGAVEHGPHGIRVNAIAPGFTRSGDPEGIPDPNFDMAKLLATIEKMVAAYPLRRMAEPQEMAEAALWLTSPASSFVTGHVLVVDGGLTAAGESVEDLIPDQ